jgi:hypothetical protein
MRRSILLFIVISLNSFSQNITKLEENNGFRDIKLGSEISNYPFAIKAERGSELFEFYVNNSYYNFNWGKEYNYVVDRSNKNYERLDNEKILGVYLSVFRGKIREIMVVCEYRPSTLALLKTVYGEPNGFWDQWSGKNIYCHYNTPYSEDKKPNFSWIRFTDKLLENEFDEENSIKEKAEKEKEQRRVNSKF